MNKKTINLLIFTPILVVSLIAAYWIGNRIYQGHIEAQKIKVADKEVILKLQKIRIAQGAYLKINGKYANDWDSLVTFIQEGNFYNVIKTEEQKKVEGRDTLIVEFDTLSVVPVFDSLKMDLGYQTKEEVKTLNVVPISDTIFTLRADVLYNGLNVCEVRDPKPINPRRQEKGDLRALQIGSLEISTLQGNWE